MPCEFLLFWSFFYAKWLLFGAFADSKFKITLAGKLASDFYELLTLISH